MPSPSGSPAAATAWWISRNVYRAGWICGWSSIGIGRPPPNCSTSPPATTTKESGVSTPCPRRRCGNFRRRAELRAALALFLVVLTGCRAAPEGPSPPVPSVQQSASSGSGLQTSAAGPHVVVIVFENHKFEQIIGNSDAPYFNKLADKYGLATSYEAVSHPSLPNYLALTGGSTFGITSDCTDCSVNSEN